MKNMCAAQQPTKMRATGKLDHWGATFKQNRITRHNKKRNLRLVKVLDDHGLLAGVPPGENDHGLKKKNQGRGKTV
jgi:hypothetical protein